MLQTIISNDHVDAIVNQHRRCPNPVRINDNRTLSAFGEQHGFISYNSRITVDIDSHRRARLATAVTATNDAGLEPPAPQLVNEPDYRWRLTCTARGDVADDNNWSTRFIGAKKAKAKKQAS